MAKWQNYKKIQLQVHVLQNSNLFPIKHWPHVDGLSREVTHTQRLTAIYNNNRHTRTWELWVGACFESAWDMSWATGTDLCTVGPR